MVPPLSNIFGGYFRIITAKELLQSLPDKEIGSVELELRTLGEEPESDNSLPSFVNENGRIRKICLTKVNNRFRR